MIRNLILCDGQAIPDATGAPITSPGVQADRAQLAWRRAPNNQLNLRMVVARWEGQTLHQQVFQLPWSSEAVGELLLDGGLDQGARTALDWALEEESTPDVGESEDFRALWLDQAAAVVC